MKTNENGTLKMEGRDWLWLIALLVGSVFSLGILHFNTVSQINAKIDAVEQRWIDKVDRMKYDLTIAAPAPATWTREAIIRLEKVDERYSQRQSDLENRIQKLSERLNRLELHPKQ